MPTYQIKLEYSARGQIKSHLKMTNQKKKKSRREPANSSKNVDFP